MYSFVYISDAGLEKVSTLSITIVDRELKYNKISPEGYPGDVVPKTGVEPATSKSLVHFIHSSETAYY